MGKQGATPGKPSGAQQSQQNTQPAPPTPQLLQQQLFMQPLAQFGFGGQGMQGMGGGPGLGGFSPLSLLHYQQLQLQYQQQAHQLAQLQHMNPPMQQPVPTVQMPPPPPPASKQPKAQQPPTATPQHDPTVRRGSVSAETDPPMQAPDSQPGPDQSPGPTAGPGMGGAAGMLKMGGKPGPVFHKVTFPRPAKSGRPAAKSLKGVSSFKVWDPKSDKGQPPTPKATRQPGEGEGAGQGQEGGAGGQGQPGTGMPPPGMVYVPHGGHPMGFMGQQQIRPITPMPANMQPPALPHTSYSMQPMGPPPPPSSANALHGTYNFSYATSGEGTASGGLRGPTPLHPPMMGTQTSLAKPQSMPSLTAMPPRGDITRPKTEAPARKQCHCKQSRCLKLYCECFSSGEYCDGCNCTDCSNNPTHEEERKDAIQIILDRNPHAFKPKIGAAAKRESGQVGRHSKGCHCKKSGCLKKYCECFQAGIPCTDICRCVDCKNLADAFIPPPDIVPRQTKRPRVAADREGVKDGEGAPSNTARTLYSKAITDDVVSSFCEVLYLAAIEHHGDGSTTEGGGAQDGKGLNEGQERAVLEECKGVLRRLVAAANQTTAAERVRAFAKVRSDKERGEAPDRQHGGSKQRRQVAAPGKPRRKGERKDPPRSVDRTPRRQTPTPLP